MLSQVTTVAPVSRVVGYGTKADWHWDALANCESGGKWNTVDAPAGGQGYDGGLGIYRPNWKSTTAASPMRPTPGWPPARSRSSSGMRIYNDYGWQARGAAHATLAAIEHVIPPDDADSFRSAWSSAHPVVDPRAPRIASGSARRRAWGRTSSRIRTPRAASPASLGSSRVTPCSRSVRASDRSRWRCSNGAPTCARSRSTHGSRRRSSSSSDRIPAPTSGSPTRWMRPSTSCSPIRPVEVRPVQVRSLRHRPGQDGAACRTSRTTCRCPS